MNIIKIILAILGAILGMMLVFWLVVFAALGYGGYKLFFKAEAKAPVLAQATNSTMYWILICRGKSMTGNI